MSTFGFNPTVHVELEYTCNKIFLNVSEPDGTNYLLVNLSHSWLLLGFTPKFWEVVGTYELYFVSL